MYIREAHPTDGRQVQANIQDNILVADPKSVEERRKVAREFAAQFKLSLPILVDGIDDPVEKAYAGWPDRIYVIDAQGKIAYKGDVGPQGFKVEEAVPALERALAGLPPETAPSLPALVRDRLGMILRRVGFSQTETETITTAAARKMEAYRGVLEGRRALIDAVRDQGDIAKALTGYQQALAKYTQAAEKIDADLDAAIAYRQKPDRLAALVALGMIGATPAPPLSGLQ
jgi:hypothetical protein